MTINLRFGLLILVISSASAENLNPSTQSFLEKLVETNSGTENISGQQAVRELIKAEFSKFNLVAEELDVSPPNGPQRKILKFSAPNSTGEIVLLGHIDTVFAANSPFQHFKVEGDKIVGPGVIDMKGGVALMGEILSQLAAEDLKRVEVLLNDDEETGSTASKTKLLELTRNAKSILVFEPGLPDASVVVSQSGVAWYNLEVQGKSAHAGLEPEKGFSACTELAYKIVEAANLADLVHGINVNPGVMEGGTKPNVVCEKASVRLDLRFKKFAELTDLELALNKIKDTVYSRHVPLNFAPSATLTPLAKLPPLETDKTAKLFSIFTSVAAELALTAKGSHVGYGSDGNNLSTGPADILVGLGPYGGGMHTQDEFMSVKSFNERLKLATGLIQELLRGGLERKLK